MSKMDDFTFVPAARQEIVAGWGNRYTIVFKCPLCGHQIKFVSKEVEKCPSCGNLIKRGLIHS